MADTSSQSEEIEQKEDSCSSASPSPIGDIARKCRGVAIAAVLFHTAVLGAAAMLPFVPLLLIPHSIFRRLWRRYTQFIQECWFGFACCLLYGGLGIRVVIHAPTDNGGVAGFVEALRDRNTVLVCNHRTRVDWMFLWGLALFLGRLGSLKIVLKESLKRAPGFGWAMQCFGFIFLSRENRVNDLQTLREGTGHHATEPGPGVAVVIFPEGTDLSESNVEKSHIYSKTKGLPLYHEVLHPKTAGFVAVVEAAGGGGDGPEACKLLDVTVGYTENSPDQRSNEKLLFTGGQPREVHFRLAMPSLAKFDHKTADKFCQDLFQEKEERLTRFYKPAREGGLPDLKAMSEGCESVDFWAGPGVMSRVTVGATVFVLLEVLGLAAAVSVPGRRVTTVGIWTVCAYELILRRGGVDGMEKWHARKWPTRGVKAKLQRYLEKID